MANDKTKKQPAKKKTAKQPRNKYLTHVEPKLLLIEAWARDGVIDEQIAKNLGVAYSTFRAYRDKYEALSAALKKGKEVVDVQVENALLKRALGYDYDEIKEEYEGGFLTKRVVTRKEVVADTTAQIFWLKNRRPDKWRNREEIEVRNNEANEMLKSIADQMSKKQTKADIQNDVADLDGV